MNDITIYSTAYSFDRSPRTLEAWVTDNTYVTIYVEKEDSSASIHLDKESLTKLVTGLQSMLENLKR